MKFRSFSATQHWIARAILNYRPKSGGFLGNIPLVNGTMNPYLKVKKAVYRFRMLGGANARIFGLTLDNGAAMTLMETTAGF
jgi:FtsP/CotA-like multicopper oxidase with cupredoxin domain